MVNTNIQGVIPLNGRGFVAKQNRNYQPGEYRRLSNCELLNGEIRGRRNILSSYGTEGAVVTPLINSYDFLGFVESYVLTASKTEQRVTAFGVILTNTTSWAPTNLPVPLDNLGNPSIACFHRIVGVFKYNLKTYWITHEYQNNVGVPDVHKICLYHTAANAGDPQFITFAMLTRTVIITESVEETASTNAPFFNNFFIHKDRLVVSLRTGVYLSKATDPTIFAVPNGAFFKFPDQRINYSMSLKDTIFSLCDEAVFSINYTSDPNTDSYVRQISDQVGGDNGVVHKDIPYLVNSVGIYAINGNSIDKVMDNIFDIGASSYKTKIAAFENYLIVIKHEVVSYDNISGFGYIKDPGKRFTPFQFGNSLGHNVFMINMDTGAIHVIDFLDYPDAGGNKGYIVDVIVNPNKDYIFRNYWCYFMTNREISTSGDTDVYHSNIYVMGPQKTDIMSYDGIYDKVASLATGTVKKFKPNIWIELEGYTPDGNEYLMKKFRSLELMGNFPFHDFTINLAWDNKDYPASPISLINSTATLEAAGTPRSPYPARVGLNQRAKSVSIELKTKDPLVPLPLVGTSAPDPSDKWDDLSISDMRVLWSYTNRASATKTPTQVT